MRIITFFIAFSIFGIICRAQVSFPASTSQLKFVVYDFDGQNLNSTDLPDGDFRSGDLTYAVAANPLPYSEVLGDRVLKLNLNWQSGIGEFGKELRFFELNASADQLNFYFYNPTSSSGTIPLEVYITEDDNQNGTYEFGADDKWLYSINIPQSGDWQLISIPLSGMGDSNAGGNGVFDASYSGGEIFTLGFSLSKPTSSSSGDQFYIDMISFSEGPLPHGPSILDLPTKDPDASCLLGALAANSPDNVPAEIESFLPSGKKLSFVNWFVYYSNSGTTANVLPGQEVQNLINKGYTPVITWEMMFGGYSRLDPVQPRLDKIINGHFDGYIDAFANKIKSYSGKVIIRIFHEFEGDWYSWSLTQNNADPATYITAFRHVVDRFRNQGAYNAYWMWCVNAEPKPWVAYNRAVSCYPGDAYVDIVATDIYNHPDLGTPAWKSFRYQMAESYYYLTKYFSNKPLYICEVASRERDNSEPVSSQSKAEWICQMNRDLQAYFNKTRAMIFFSVVKEHDWRINSSPGALQSFINCVWNDPFYNGPVDIREENTLSSMKIYPNPFLDEIKFDVERISDTTKNVDVSVYDAMGKLIISRHLQQLSNGLKTNGLLPPGLYILEMKNNLFTRKSKIVKTEN